MVSEYFNKKYLYEYISVSAAALTFLAVGLQLGAVSPILVKLVDDGYYDMPQISSSEQSWMASFLTLGILPGAAIASYANDIVGRKYSMMSMVLPLLLSQIMAYFAVNVWMFFLSQIFRGVACAWVFSVVPTYVSEIASPNLRGPFTVFCVLFLSVGNFIGSLVQAALSIDLTAIIFSIVAVLVFVILFIISETPYFYITKEKDENCKQTLRKLRREKNVDQEYEEIKSAWNENLKVQQVSWAKIFTVASNRKAFFICAGVQSVQQFTGHIVMSANIHSVVKNSGLDLSLIQISIIISSVNVGASVLSIFVVDSWGRRPLFMTVCIGGCLGHFLTGLGFFLEDSQSETTTLLGITELTGNLIYLSMIGLGLMHLPNILGAELFPTDVKSKGCSLLMVVSSIEGVVVIQAFDLLSKIKYYVPFWTMAVCALIGLVFGIFFVPETKNKSLTEIQKERNLK